VNKHVTSDYPSHPGGFPNSWELQVMGDMLGDNFHMKKFRRNVLLHYLARETEANIGLCSAFTHENQVTPALISRLGLDTELEGHGGCVNCLEWNNDGSILASGSDDSQIIIWNPLKKKKLRAIQTGHRGNIFTVKFLPKSGDNTIISGAADCFIRVHDVSSSAQTIHVCTCHSGRVKRIAVTKSAPYLFWSAAEDAKVMQFDLRCPHSCNDEAKNSLINLKVHAGPEAELKCISINQQQPQYIAVGANDPYIRLYDRRMITPQCITYSTDVETPSDEGIPPDSVHYYVAGHLPLRDSVVNKKRNLAATYVTFSPDGGDLLVNLGGEQVYLFNTLNPQRPKIFDLDLIIPKAHTNGYSNGYKNGVHSSQNGVTSNQNGVTATQNGVTNGRVAPSKTYKSPPLPLKVEAIKLEANCYFEKACYSRAIQLFNEALDLLPTAAILYGNRAAAYMKRSWDGDIYAALRDCYTALHLDPNHLKAHFRLARCLYELQWSKEASQCLSEFKNKFPEHTTSHAYQALDKDIRTANFTKQDDDVDEEGSKTSSPHSSRQHKSSISKDESTWRAAAYDYDQRFCGHCNTTTDIKEANFFGSAGQYICAGSDDGSFFIWERRTGNLIKILSGDDSIVNCLQPHPTYCMLATSGIDPVIRLWTPQPQDGRVNSREVMDMHAAATKNQERMGSDPVEVMISNMGYRISGLYSEEGEGLPHSEPHMVNCRPS